MKNIIERVISPPPNKYEAYLYQYTNLSDDKKYVGYHKGSVDDNYNHSSTCKEFAKVFADSKSKLKFEVIKYGSLGEIKTAENSMLKSANARNNPLYYNKHNGAPSYDEPDLDKVKFLVQQITDRVFPVFKEELALHEDMSYSQVRFEHNPELQKTIKEKINDANGNTDGCNPLIICEKRRDGEDLRIDGNHTLFGASQSKHANDIPVMRLPYDVHKDFSEIEINMVGNLLNKKSEVVKRSMSQQDGIKHVINAHKTGVPFNSQFNVTFLKECNFTGSGSSGQIKAILDKSKQLIDQEDKAISGQLFIRYHAKPHKSVLEAKVKSLSQKEGETAIGMSSSMFNVARIFETLWAVRDDKDVKKDVKKLTVVVHHKDTEASKAWKSKTQPLWINILDKLMKSEYEIEFHEMPMWIDDGSKI